jgi:hypothetical protein
VLWPFFLVWGRGSAALDIPFLLQALHLTDSVCIMANLVFISRFGLCLLACMGLAGFTGFSSNAEALPVRKTVGVASETKLAITSPAAFQMVQRSRQTNQADLRLEGEFRGELPQTIQVNYRQQGWKTLPVTQTGANQWRATLSAQACGTGALQVRLHEKASALHTVGSVGVGDVYLVMGQTLNALDTQGEPQQYQTPHEKLSASAYFVPEGGSTNPHWRDLQNLPWWCTRLAEHYLREEKVPVGFIATAWWDSDLFSWTPESRDLRPTPWGDMSLLNRSKAAVAHSGTQGIRGVLWVPSEVDASLTPESYAQNLKHIAESLYGQYRAPMLVSQLQPNPKRPSFYGVAHTINPGIASLWQQAALGQLPAIVPQGAVAPVVASEPMAQTPETFGTPQGTPELSAQNLNYFSAQQWQHIQTAFLSPDTVNGRSGKALTASVQYLETSVLPFSKPSARKASSMGVASFANTVPFLWSRGQGESPLAFLWGGKSSTGNFRKAASASTAPLALTQAASFTQSATTTAPNLLSPSHSIYTSLNPPSPSLTGNPPSTVVKRLPSSIYKPLKSSSRLSQRWQKRLAKAPPLTVLDKPVALASSAMWLKPSASVSTPVFTSAEYSRSEQSTLRAASQVSVVKTSPAKREVKPLLDRTPVLASSPVTPTPSQVTSQAVSPSSELLSRKPKAGLISTRLDPWQQLSQVR